MTTYLVTGGTGFLGQHLVRQLLRDDQAQVVVLARSRDRSLERLGARFVKGSVLEPEDLDAALQGVDGIYHLAGKVERNLERSHTLHTLHVTGTRHVIEAAGRAGVRRVVVASTSGTVGVTRDGHTIPDDRAEHATEIVKGWPYYLSKVYAERAAIAAARRAKVELILMRPTLLLGPGDERLSSTRDVKLFIDGKIPIVPPGGISFVDVRDTAAAFRAAMERGRPGAAYLLGAANMTMEAFFERLENISGVRRPFARVPQGAALFGARLLDATLNALGRSSDLDPISVEMSQHFWYIDWSAAIQDLGFQPRDPGETLYDTVQWLRAHGQAAERRAKTPPAERSPFRPQTHADPQEDAAWADAPWSRPEKDAWGEPAPRDARRHERHERHERPHHAPTSYVGQSKLSHEEILGDGPGLEGLVSGLGGTLSNALGGLMKGRRGHRDE